MAVVVWVTGSGWAAAVNSALVHSPSSDELVLVHVVPGDIEEIPRGGFAGLLGRGRQETDPRALAEQAAGGLLAAARQRAGNRQVRIVNRRGRPEREVVAAAAGADLLVLARDGDDRWPGPQSLGPRARYVVEHASCAVLLVWPGDPPDTGGIPAPGPPER